MSVTRVPIFTILSDKSVETKVHSIMGNMHTSNYSEQIPLGDSSVVALLKTKTGRGREAVDTWSAEYNSFGRTTCELDLTKTSGNNYNREQELTITIHDHASDHANDYVDFQMVVTVKEDLLLGNVKVNGPRTMLRLPQCKTLIVQGGGVLKSSSLLYGRNTDRKGLIVMLRAKRRDDEKEDPYMITVKHYFVAACCSHGVSVVAKIRRSSNNSSDEGMSVEIEKPSKHPKRELLFMFDDVQGKGWWPDPSTRDLTIELPNQHKDPANANHPFSPNSISGHQNIGNGGNFNGDGNGCQIYNPRYYYHYYSGNYMTDKNEIERYKYYK